MKERAPRGRLIALTLILCGVGAFVLFLVLGSVPVGYAKGRVIGEAERVVITDPMRGLVVEGELREDGTYICSIPRPAREPVIVIHGPGTSLVRSVPFEPEDTELPVVGLWSAELLVRFEDGMLRFEWPPIPSGEGYPDPRRYSLLIAYKKTDGTRGEASLIASQPHMTLPLVELEETLNGWDPLLRDVVVTLRAFKPGDVEGALWVACERPWTLPKAPQEEAPRDR